jgi:hypothetical protein
VSAGASAFTEHFDNRTDEVGLGQLRPGFNYPHQNLITTHATHWEVLYSVASMCPGLVWELVEFK